jgi:predicted dehydrogenase
MVDMSIMQTKRLRGGMVGVGMIFDETYRPFFEQAHRAGLHDRRFGDVDVPLVGIASRTGKRAEKYRKTAGANIGSFQSFAGDNAVADLIDAGIDFACVATPDDRHFEAAKQILESGVHLLVEKPSVLTLQQLD